MKGEAALGEQGQEPMLGALGLPPGMVQSQGGLLQAVAALPTLSELVKSDLRASAAFLPAGGREAKQLGEGAQECWL